MCVTAGQPCPDLFVANSNMTSDAAGVFGDRVFVECVEGFQLSFDVTATTTTTAEVVCSDGAQWLPPTQCTSKARTTCSVVVTFLDFCSYICIC